ncbi:acyl carrier protein [Rhodococcus sp. NPDC058521]|uniref:acyl carrier protein n=1 Tax=Rhodococcus sp. NPDC058521 TaxID=3346536 RepID=UPI00364F5643
MTERKVRAIVGAMSPSPTTAGDDELRLVEDLGYDSLRLMELTVALERAFELPPFRPEQLAPVRTVGAVVKLIEGSS